MTKSVYANARASALHNSLLGLNRLNRMIESESPKDALRVLSEVNFGEGIPVDSALDFEKILDVEKKKFYDFIRETAPDENYAKYFLLKNDYHNAQAIMRSKYLKINPDAMLTSDGIYTREQLKESIMIDEYKKFSKELAYALSSCDVEFVNGRATGEVIDSIFQKQYFAETARISKKDALLSELFTNYADFTNIGVALRTRSYAAAKKNFVKGGTLSDFELGVLCETPLDALQEKFRFSALYEFIRAAAESAENNEPLTKFELLKDGFALKTLKKKKYDLTGNIPFALYCYYRAAEIENVRIVMVCLNNGVPKTEIKSRLRENYEG